MSKPRAPMNVTLPSISCWLALGLLLACGKRSYAAPKIIPDLLCNMGVGSNSLLNLRCMLECILHIEPFSRYVNYGCWCGIGGEGEPVDNIDKCCQSHDFCYDDALKKGVCNRLELYLTWYWWRCTNGHPSCLDKQRSRCAAALCECDRRVALCLANEPIPTKRQTCNKTSSEHEPFYRGKFCLDFQPEQRIPLDEQPFHRLKWLSCCT